MRKTGKIGQISFIAVGLWMCALPFVGMFLAPTDSTTENRELAAFPDIIADGEWNLNFLQEMGAYFEDHFAFRQELVSIDAIIQSKAFGVSNAESVTVGKDGWLYYSSTTEDYLGRNLMSERTLFNAAHNLSLVQQYVQEQGASFVFTVAPNKNSLYGEDMPYYLQKKAGNVRNMDLLRPMLENHGVSYVDLFALFQRQEETLYLKRDSHWNQKGAVLAYDALLDYIGVEHDDYETVKAVRQKDAYGDLNKMLYPLAAEPEWDYDFQKADRFSYQTRTESVEDAWIETENPQGRGSLLMFRDSFGNTLLPLMANTFSKGYFSRGEPQNIGALMETYCPDAVIIEKVERNIAEFAQNPPLLESVAVNLEEKESAGKEPAPQEKETLSGSAGVLLEIAECKENTAYWMVSGVLDEAYCAEDVRVYVKIADGGQTVAREAFTVTTEESDYGYCLYLCKDRIFHDYVGIQIFVESGGKLREVRAEDVKLQ